MRGASQSLKVKSNRAAIHVVGAGSAEDLHRFFRQSTREERHPVYNLNNVNDVANRKGFVGNPVRQYAQPSQYNYYEGIGSTASSTRRGRSLNNEVRNHIGTSFLNFHSTAPFFGSASSNEGRKSNYHFAHITKTNRRCIR